MRWLCRLFRCKVALGLREKGIRAWDDYQRNPQDSQALDRCIKYWRKLYRKKKRSDSADRNQVLEFLVTALLEKSRHNAGSQPEGKVEWGLGELEEAAGLAPELHEGVSRDAPDHVYDILISLADSFASAFQCSRDTEEDIRLLETGIEWYRKAAELAVDPGKLKDGKVRLCRALLDKRPPNEGDLREASAALQDANTEPIPPSLRANIADLFTLLNQLSGITVTVS